MPFFATLQLELKLKQTESETVEHAAAMSVKYGHTPGTPLTQMHAHTVVPQLCAGEGHNLAVTSISPTDGAGGVRHCLLPCVSTAFAAKMAPLPGISTAFAAQTLPLPCVSTAFAAKTLLLPLAFPLPSWPGHCLCLVFPLPS